jgi:hypothetical protein
MVPVVQWMAVTFITLVPVQPIRATILPKVEMPTVEATIRLHGHREVHLPTVRRRTVRLQEASRITARLAEPIQPQEANLTALRPVLTVSRRTAPLQEVTVRHPAVEAAVAVVQAVLQEVQDNPRLS